MSNTLVIKYLPHTFNDNEKIDFLIHFGARNVKILSSQRKKYSLAFATFTSNCEAENALRKLHQLDVSGSKLNVEFSKSKLPDPPRPERKLTECKTSSNLNDFINSLNAFNSSINFMQPPPPHIKYKYPLPNRATLRNIMFALASNNKFYTQVCHLMNRMNLPPPFSTVPDSVVEQQELYQFPEKSVIPPENIIDEGRRNKSDDESEIESDPDEQKFKDPLIIENKPKRTLKRPNITKIHTMPEYIPKSKQPKLSTEEVFEKVDIANKKIELKVASDAISKIPERKEDVEVGGFGIFHHNVPENVKQNETEKTKEVEKTCTDYISSKQLSENRLTTANYSSLPAFKNYNPGPPSCRLYIKNLAKSVTLEDLHFIYKRYLIPDYQNGEETLLIYDVKLMQEGRMKGQAFITLQNETQAKLALKETNGYILKEKPMVVAFARSAKAS